MSDVLTLTAGCMLASSARASSSMILPAHQTRQPRGSNGGYVQSHVQATIMIHSMHVLLINAGAVHPACPEGITASKPYPAHTQHHIQSSHPIHCTHLLQSLPLTAWQLPQGLDDRWQCSHPLAIPVPEVVHLPAITADRQACLIAMRQQPVCCDGALQAKTSRWLQAHALAQQPQPSELLLTRERLDRLVLRAKRC